MGVLWYCIPTHLSHRTIPHAFISRRDGIPVPSNGFCSALWHFDASRLILEILRPVLLPLSAVECSDLS